MTEPAKPGPLSDLLVVEMGQLIAGPFCGQLLGDFGARVIKVEPPGAGDPMRVWGRGEHVWWEVIARNKQSVSINLRIPEGQALARRLIAKADVLIENFRPGALEGWNLDPKDLRRENPGLIVVRMSGYGQTGPYAARTGFGGVGEAMGGWRRIVGDPDRPPSRMGVSIGDSLTATYGCLGVLAALHHREKTGEGQVIDAALYESVLQVMESLVPEYAVSGIVRERSGSYLPGIAPSNVYACKDGDYLIGANQDGIFRRLCQAMGLPDLADDPRYATHVARGANQIELDQRIEAWTRTLTIAEVEALMVEHSIPAGRIYSAADMIEDPHFAAREAIVEVAHPRFAGLKMQNVFPKLSATPGAIRTIAPQAVGEHNAEVLGGLLGLDADALEALHKAGAV
ncbi:CaiB/BaiF CoA transferase family protein [Phenylobacterium montanum]|uniref:CoA transferase n=1 Tax=Phenylobacterium montanum TaxID=2823693 RepID=A0A975ITF7_9CAUL|nr:CoA transferase [Caulobacter sp. S6]QUD86685.1 CoA transferase [Caulobacter sp. S6]